MGEDHALLERFKQLLQVSRRISKDEVAEGLGVDKKELVRLILSWGDLGFKIDKDEIVVDDMGSFIDNIDGQFTAWHGMGASDARKIGDTHVAAAPVSMASALERAEAAVLLELERQLGELIPKVDNVVVNTFGFSAAGGHVTGLGLYRKGLTSLPETVGQLKSLETLYLGWNKLTSLPEAMGQLRTLTRLNLFHNQLKSLMRRRSLVENSRESGPPIQWARGSHADLHPKGAGSEACVAM